MTTLRYVILFMDVLMLALAAAGGLNQALAGNWWHALTYALLACWIGIARIRAIQSNKFEDKGARDRQRAQTARNALDLIRKTADRVLTEAE